MGGPIYFIGINISEYKFKFKYFICLHSLFLMADAQFSCISVFFTNNGTVPNKNSASRALFQNSGESILTKKSVP